MAYNRKWSRQTRRLLKKTGCWQGHFARHLAEVKTFVLSTEEMLRAKGSG